METIARPKKFKIREMTQEEKKKLEDRVKVKVDKLIEPKMSSITYHCEGACGPGCGSEVAGACPPCP